MCKTMMHQTNKLTALTSLYEEQLWLVTQSRTVNSIKYVKQLLESDWTAV